MTFDRAEEIQACVPSIAGHASVDISYLFAYFSDGLAGKSTDSLQAWKPQSMK